ncbi:MAG: hypothetical protein HN957_04985 [Gammaproteobacteria bacterium]|jgi:hypothetical protein|nr:hypothetical protein [Gammaproteobacteria bacterium]
MGESKAATRLTIREGLLGVDETTHLRTDSLTLKKAMKMTALLTTLIIAMSACTKEKQNFDAVEVAGNHHRLLFENETVRVLEVIIPPGETTEFHSHPMSGVFLTTQPATRVSRNLEGEVFKTTMREDFDPFQPAQWREGSDNPVSVTVTDSIAMKVIRIEMKAGR